MSEIKVDKIQGTSGTSTALTLSGANSTVNGTLNVDGAVTLDSTFAVTGVHTVGTNAVATSDGGAVTTNVTQGLAKMWVHSESGALTDSFNVSGMTDNAVGDYRVAINNNMANATYATGMSKESSGYSKSMTMEDGTCATTGFDMLSVKSDGLEDQKCFAISHGDLA
jgi:hypothetical protein